MNFSGQRPPKCCGLGSHHEHLVRIGGTYLNSTPVTCSLEESLGGACWPLLSTADPFTDRDFSSAMSPLIATGTETGVPCPLREVVAAGAGGIIWLTECSVRRTIREDGRRTKIRREEGVLWNWSCRRCCCLGQCWQLALQVRALYIGFLFPCGGAAQVNGWIKHVLQKCIKIS